MTTHTVKFSDRKMPDLQVEAKGICLTGTTVLFFKNQCNNNTPPASESPVAMVNLHYVASISS